MRAVSRSQARMTPVSRVLTINQDQSVPGRCPVPSGSLPDTPTLVILMFTPRHSLVLLPFINTMLTLNMHDIIIRRVELMLTVTARSPMIRSVSIITFLEIS